MKIAKTSLINAKTTPPHSRYIKTFYVSKKGYVWVKQFSFRDWPLPPPLGYTFAIFTRFLDVFPSRSPDIDQCVWCANFFAHNKLQTNHLSPAKTKGGSCKIMASWRGEFRGWTVPSSMERLGRKKTYSDPFFYLKIKKSSCLINHFEAKIFDLIFFFPNILTSGHIKFFWSLSSKTIEEEVAF